MNQLQHLAIIMDGNRRWSKQNNKETLDYSIGIERIIDTIKFCISKKISYLTLFAFSFENNKRSEVELNIIFNLLHQSIDHYRDFLIENKISVKFIGDKLSLSSNTNNKINNLEQSTIYTITNLNLIIAFNYGGKQEIVQAVNQILEKSQLKEVNEKIFSDHLYTSSIPDPDFLIRTGGEMRLSNFLIWQTTYTELYFTKTNWPDFTINELEIAIQDFYQRKRNFGL